MKKVVVLKIEDYKPEILKEKIERALLKHFPYEELFSPADKILLKPNLLMNSSPQEAIVTHPVFLEVIGKFFKNRGLSVYVADSPGTFVSKEDVDYIYESTGIKEICKSNGFSLLYPTARVVREGFPLCWWVDSFKIVNLPKLKTHSITALTLAVKNLYGCISGRHKSYLHYLHPKTEEFTGVIMNLYKLIKPCLNIVDGILALEGNGPAKNGKPRKLGIVVVGDDALYTDYVISKLLKLKDEFNPLIKRAKKEGLIEEENLEVISEIGDHIRGDFKFPSPFIVNCLPSVLVYFFGLFLKFKPAIDREKCRVCGACLEICPKKAVEIKHKTLLINYKRCSMCMCCEEACQFKAVYLKRSVLLKIMEKFHPRFP